MTPQARQQVKQQRTCRVSAGRVLRPCWLLPSWPCLPSSGFGLTLSEKDVKPRIPFPRQAIPLARGAESQASTCEKTHLNRGKTPVVCGKNEMLSVPNRSQAAERHSLALRPWHPARLGITPARRSRARLRLSIRRQHLAVASSAQHPQRGAKQGAQGAIPQHLLRGAIGQHLALAQQQAATDLRQDRVDFVGD